MIPLSAVSALAWIRSHKRPSAIGAGVALAVIVLLAFAFCRRRDNPIPAREQFSVDSLRATKPDADSIRKAVTDSAKRVAAKLAADSASAHVADSVNRSRDREVARLHRLADSAMAVARAHDGAPAGETPFSSAAAPDTDWKLAAEARTAEAEQLTAQRDTARAQRDSARSELRLSRSTIEGLIAQTARDAARINASEAPKTGLNARLARDVQTASECTILHFFGCPSREVVAIGGVILGGVVGYELAKR